jgi:hypothetical protein
VTRAPHTSAPATAPTVQTLIIRARMPGLNDLLRAKMQLGAKTSASGKRWNGYAAMKRKYGSLVSVCAYAQGFMPITEPVHFEYEFGEPTRQRDPSNLVAGGVKAIEDGLQEAGLLPNDNWEWVLSFVATWKVSKEPYVKVTVRT